jgi:hypothetical protein
MLIRFGGCAGAFVGLTAGPESNGPGESEEQGKSVCNDKFEIALIGIPVVEPLADILSVTSDD